MSRLRFLLTEVLWLLSEMEAIPATTGSSLVLRRLFLRSRWVKYGKHLWIGRSFRLMESGRLVLGDRCSLGDYVYIQNSSRITIGDDFLSASRLMIYSGSHDCVTLMPTFAPVSIGNRVWCGANVTILPGVTIGDDVVIGAGSVVRGEVPSNSVVAGVPARVIRPLDRPVGATVASWTNSWHYTEAVCCQKSVQSHKKI